MRQTPRADVGGEIDHALNRGNGRATIFRKDADYQGFRAGAQTLNLLVGSTAEVAAKTNSRTTAAPLQYEGGSACAEIS